MHKYRWLMAVLGLVLAFGGLPWNTGDLPVAYGQNGPSAGCNEINKPQYDGHYTNTVLFSGYQFYAGESITLSVQFAPGTGIAFRLYSIPGIPRIIMGQSSVTMKIPVSRDAVPKFSWQASDGTWSVWCDSPYTLLPPQPGPEMFMPLEGAVMGRFVHDTPAYWAPDASLSPSANLRAGQTAWVRGMDASGKFYQIVWVADLLWVPADAIGPATDDPLWQGAPLPTGVVE